MISELRQYINERVKEVDSYLEYFEDDVTGEEDVNSTMVDKNYKVFFKPLELENIGINSYRDILPLSIEIYGERGIDITKNFDDLFTKAVKIRNHIIAPVNAKDKDFMTDIFALPVEMSSEETNSNALKAVLNFEVIRDFCLR